MHSSREAQYRAFFVDAYPDALRFAQRRAEASVAEEVVADALLVVWRRFDEAPQPHGERRAWLFGIVRNTLSNALRAHHRRDALAVRLVDHAFAEPHGDHADDIGTRVDIARAWGSLTPRDQEVLALSILDGLSATEAATVLGITAVGFRQRLARARRALQAAIEQPRSRASATNLPSVPTPTSIDDTQEARR